MGHNNHNSRDSDVRFQEKFGDCKEIGMSRSSFCHLLSHPDLEHLLEDLDIETCNPVELFDVLDADMSGELDIEEIISGLLSLRGPAEKKDAVGALLCGRVTQQ